ncbi:hypothetical protein NAF17_15350 [Mucilaginibacter sp. RB4R14]|uniref:hypothetical protein n=1 Tax=Mucilaginibacter aurantiaciroseus TaxID=2949308 RepID=UPI002090F906|nr:hypothetical protein [Mucilaginibacter aurantiaciroseus]MCO5936918.1 hypothetical protein [Mucilaginibacter aurantiaciroseus]
MNANQFMPALLMVVTDLDAQTTLLTDKGIEESDHKKVYHDINAEISTVLLKLFADLNILEKVQTLGMAAGDKGIINKLWEELSARVAAYQGDELNGTIAKLLDLKNKQRDLFTYLTPFTRI